MKVNNAHFILASPIPEENSYPEDLCIVIKLIDADQRCMYCKAFDLSVPLLEQTS